MEELSPLSTWTPSNSSWTALEVSRRWFTTSHHTSKPSRWQHPTWTTHQLRTWTTVRLVTFHTPIVDSCPRPKWFIFKSFPASKLSMTEGTWNKTRWTFTEGSRRSKIGRQRRKITKRTWHDLTSRTIREDSLLFWSSQFSRRLHRLSLIPRAWSTAKKSFCSTITTSKKWERWAQQVSRSMIRCQEHTNSTTLDTIPRTSPSRAPIRSLGRSATFLMEFSTLSKCIIDIRASRKQFPRIFMDSSISSLLMLRWMCPCHWVLRHSQVLRNTALSTR